MQMIPDFEYLKVSLENHIAHIEINRPDKANAMNMQCWLEIGSAHQWADEEPDVRVVLLSGAGNHFTSGIDVTLLAGMEAIVDHETCEGRKREKLRRQILELQNSFNQIEACRVPVLATIHGGCIGGGMDMISACDMRYCSEDAYFMIKEIDMGMTADVGTLQRLPYIIGDGMMRELSYTGRKIDAQEAKEIGLVNRVYRDKKTLMQEVGMIAQSIADKSPLSIRGIKEMIVYTRDHSVADSLNYIATWNASMLLSKDLEEAMRSQMQKRKPTFDN